MAAGSTYTPLAAVTASGVSSVLVMSSIPSTYTDLVLIGVFPKAGAGSTRLNFNSVTTGGLYSQTVLYGNGGSTGSGREVSSNQLFLLDFLSSSTTQPNMAIIHLMNYSNTTTFKTILDRSGVAGNGTTASAGLFRSTSAISRIDISDASNFSTGTTFTLYGIAAA